MLTKKEELSKSNGETREALESLAPQYHKYITMIGRKVKCKDGEQWIDKPYLAVDGRIAMFVDENRSLCQGVSIETEFSEIAGQVVCKATVIGHLGTAVGTARAFVESGAGGFVDRTNPLENAETSAIGRALGFLGYGLLGGGIASADEIEVAQQAQAVAPTVTEKPKPNKKVTPPSEKQLSYIKVLIDKLIDHPEFKSFDLDDKEEVSKGIEYYKSLEDKPEDDEATKIRKKFWVEVREGLAVSGKDKDDLKDYIMKTWGLDSSKDLTVRQRAACIEWAAQPDMPELTEEEVKAQMGELKSAVGTIGEEDDVPDPENPSNIWGSVKAEFVDKGFDWNEVQEYLLDEYRPAGDDFWKIPQKAAERFAAMLALPGQTKLLKAEIDEWAEKQLKG